MTAISGDQWGSYSEEETPSNSESLTTTAPHNSESVNTTAPRTPNIDPSPVTDLLSDVDKTSDVSKNEGTCDDGRATPRTDHMKHDLKRQSLEERFCDDIDSDVCHDDLVTPTKHEERPKKHRSPSSKSSQFQRLLRFQEMLTKDKGLPRSRLQSQIDFRPCVTPSAVRHRQEKTQKCTKNLFLYGPIFGAERGPHV